MKLLERKEKTASQPKKDKQFSRLRIISFALIIIFFVLTLFSFYYIYNKVTTSLEHTAEMLYIKSEISAEVIDYDRLERVYNGWQNKQKVVISTDLRDPFNAPAASTTTKKKL